MRTLGLSSSRDDSLDILRGLALAGMLLVNNPGSWSHVYWPLLHAPWHGLTPTDLVFPFFLFVVGGAMAFSFKTQLSQNAFNWTSIIRRAGLLFLIGVLLSAFPYTKSIDEWRLFGVLQRIGLCFLLAAIAIRFLKPPYLWFVCGLTLVTYILLLNGYSDTPYSQQNNLVRTLDLILIGEAQMYKGLGFAFDPEGLLSTLPATITCLIGYLVTLSVQQKNEYKDKISLLLIVGVCLTLLGAIGALIDPINKSLWTSTYVLVTAGLACLSLAFITFVWNSLNLSFGLQALKVYGSNPILIFVLAGLFARILNLVKVESGISLKQWCFQILSDFMPAKIASLTFALLFMLSFYLLSLFLYRRKIFIKL